MEPSRRWLAVAATLIAMLVPGLALGSSHGCGEASSGYVCGNILVLLTPGADDIAAVIERNGGSADDLDHTFRGMGGPTGDDVYYVVNVPTGTEVEGAARYAADPDVFAAMVNQEELGSTTVPNTAVETDVTPTFPVATVSLLVAIILTATAVLRRHASR